MPIPNLARSRDFRPRPMRGPIGFTPPYGWREHRRKAGELIPAPDEQIITWIIQNLAAEGLGRRAIATWLNWSICLPRAQAFHAATVHEVLTRATA
jgi:hypothetical protein